MALRQGEYNLTLPDFPRNANRVTEAFCSIELWIFKDCCWSYCHWQLRWNFCFDRWFKDGQPVGKKAGHKVLLNGQKLVISQAQVSDSGHYKCVAANKAGEHEKEFDVTVHGRLLKVGRKQQTAFISHSWKEGAQTFYKCLFALAGWKTGEEIRWNRIIEWFGLDTSHSRDTFH